MAAALTSVPARSRLLTWEQWQGSSVSARLLSTHDRQAGYTVAWIPPSFRQEFLAFVQALRLYDSHFHKPKRAMGPAQLDAWRAWTEATQALIAVLQELS